MSYLHYLPFVPSHASSLSSRIAVPLLLLLLERPESIQDVANKSILESKENCFPTKKKRTRREFYNVKAKIIILKYFVISYTKLPDIKIPRTLRLIDGES